MNWKEQLTKRVFNELGQFNELEGLPNYDKFGREAIAGTIAHDVHNFISSEIIEKLIQDIKRQQTYIFPQGEGASYIKVVPLIRELRNKWLN